MSELDNMELFTDGPGAPHSGSETSKEAAEAIQPDLPRLEMLVWWALRARPRTDSEIQAVTGLSGDTERPRRLKLVEKGLVEDSGERRVPEGKRQRAIVWRLVER